MYGILDIYDIDIIHLCEQYFQFPIFPNSQVIFEYKNWVFHFVIRAISFWFPTQGQRGQRAGDVVRGQHLPRVGGDAAAGGRVGRQRDAARALPAAPPARHAPAQASVHAAVEAHEVSTALTATDWLTDWLVFYYSFFKLILKKVL